MRQNDLGQIILSEEEFLEITSTELEDVENFIRIYGEDVTLGELRDSLQEKEIILG